MGIEPPGEKSSWEIRPATPDDYEEIVGVWTSSGLSVRITGRDNRPSFLRQLARFPDLYLVAVEKGEVVGVVLGTHDHRKGWINRLAVKPGHRREGLGRELVLKCEQSIHARGIEILAALVDPENSDSCQLFEQLGYRSDVDVRYFRKLRRADI